MEAHAGERPERDELIAQYLPLAYRLARRYLPSGEPYEDLVQIASLGLVKAADRYDPERGTTFMTFAVPTIVGELNRYLRDCTWAIHVDRRSKDWSRQVASARNAISSVIGRRPSVRELASHLDCSLEAVVEGLQAAAARETISLEAPIKAASDNPTPSLMDELGHTDDELERTADVATIFAAARHLSKRERVILYLRFGEDLTQTEIATRIGISQMHVSRIIREAVERVREMAGESEAA